MWKEANAASFNLYLLYFFLPGKKKKSIKSPIRLATTCSKDEQQQDAKIMLNYRPNGRRRHGRPLKRLLDEVETGLSRFNL
jgi:hypothetical protein